MTPPALSRLIRRCLRKDIKARWQSAGDARLELDDALAGSRESAATVAAPPRKMAWLPAGAFTAAGAAIALLASTLMQPRATVTGDAPVMRYTILLPSTLRPVGAPTISPDGKWIAITAIGPRAGAAAATSQDITMAIWLRPMDAQTFQPIAGTEQAMNPAWSPDSRELLFFAHSGLHRIAITGGTPTRVAEVAMAGGPNAAWGTDGTILLSTRGQIFRVSANGGTPTQLTTVDAVSNATHVVPSWLPGDRYLFTEFAGTALGLPFASSLKMQSLAGGTPARLIEGRALARYTPQALLAARMNVTGVDVATISAYRFDPEHGTSINRASCWRRTSARFSVSPIRACSSIGARRRAPTIGSSGWTLRASRSATASTCRDRVPSISRATDGWLPSRKARTSRSATSDVA
jgi:hypothetical protein